MPLFYIHTVNCDFQSRDDGVDYDRPEDALAAGVLGALDIISDEVQQGKATAAVDVRIQREDGKAILRSVVALSVSPLLADGDEPQHP